MILYSGVKAGNTLLTLAATPSPIDHQTKPRLFLRIEACRLKSCSPDSLQWSNSTKPTTGGVLVKSVEQLV